MANANGIIVQSVVKALTILSCFANNKKELGISEISQQMEINKSTVYALVNSLVQAGFLEQNPETKRYVLGIKLFEYGTIVARRMDLFSDAKPHCEDLSKEIGATVHLAAKYDNRIVYIGKVDNPDDFIVYSRIGKSVPLHCTGVGKAILAFLPSDDIEKLIHSDLTPYTKYTITAKGLLFENLSLIRERGYALDNEEIQLGLRCVAAPIFNHENKPVAAISISGPVSVITSSRIDEVAGRVLHHAEEISKKLGYKGASPWCGRDKNQLRV